MNRKEIFDLKGELAKKLAQEKVNKNNGKRVKETYGETLARIDNIVVESDKGVNALKDEDEKTLARLYKEEQVEQILKENKTPESGVEYRIETKNGIRKYFIKDDDDVVTSITVNYNGTNYPIDEFYFMYKIGKVSFPQRDYGDPHFCAKINLETNIYSYLPDITSKDSDLKVKRIKVLTRKQEDIITSIISMTKIVDKRLI